MHTSWKLGERAYGLHSNIADMRRRTNTVRQVAATLSWLLLCLSLSRQVSGAGSTCSGPEECPRFRVFYDQRDEQYLGNLSSAERLQFAAATGGDHVVRMIRPFQTGISQNDSNLNLDCSPWRLQVGDATGGVQWTREWLDEDGIPTGSVSVFNDSTIEDFTRVGGEHNEWFNISRITAVLGVDSSIITCQVCGRSQCHNSSYTLKVIGIPPVILNNTVGCVSRSSTEQVTMSCGIDSDSALPVPTPTRTWYKDGVVVYSNQIGDTSPDPNDDFFVNEPLLTPELLDPDALVLSGGNLTYNTRVDNITSPELLAMMGIAISDVEGLIFNLLLGNWTCVLQNEVGTASVQYIVQECPEPPGPDTIVVNLIPTNPALLIVEPRSSIRSFFQVPFCLEVSDSGLELLQNSDNLSFSVETSDDSINVTTEGATLSSTSSSSIGAAVIVTHYPDDIALEGMEEIELRLVPLPPWNEMAGVQVVVEGTFEVRFIDSDTLTVSWSEREYQVLESDGKVMLQLVKDKRIAQRLELVVTVLTLREAVALGCHNILADVSLADTADFVSRPYFESVVVFEVDEGLPDPINKVNVSIEVVDDEDVEKGEFFVATVEPRNPCQIRDLHGEGYSEQPLIFSTQSVLVHIIADSCRSSITYSPLIGIVEWPITRVGSSAVSTMCPIVTEEVILISRFCNANRVWSEPDYENCLQAIVDRDFDDISNRLNQTNISAVEVMELVSDLRDTVGNAAEEGAGQNPTNLEVVDEALRTVRRFLEENEGFVEPGADGEVIEQVVEVLDGISDWPEDVVQERSTNIVESFEAIATSLVNQSNMTNLTFVTEDVIFHGERRSVEELIQNGQFVSFTAGNVSLNEQISKEDISTISLPSSLYKTLRMTMSDDLIGQFFTSYSDGVLFPIANADISNLTTMVIGSSVLAANVLSDQPIRDLAEPITLEFKVQNLTDALSVSCVSWDFRAAGGRGNWTTSGCKVVKSDEDTNTTTCQCNHLTPFSVIITICRRIGTCPNLNENFQRALETVFYVGASISSLCLIATIVIVAALLLMKSRSSKDRERQSAIQFKFYIQLSLALLLMYIVFMAGIRRTERFAVCVLFSSLIHYFSLTSVMWMTASCGFIFWIMVVDPFAKARFNNIHMVIITIVCWIIPLLPVVIPLAIDRDHMVGYNTTGEERRLEYCFTGNTAVFFSAFIGPLLLLLALNTVMYISITYVQLRYICCTRKKRIIAQSDDQKGTKSSVVEHFLTALKLLCIFCMFGLGWLFGALGITQVMAYISSTLFVVFTSLQGLFIFVFLCILSKDALMLYKRFCCKYSATFQTSYDSQSTKTSTMAGKNGSREDKGDTLKSALAQELAVKVKENEYELDNVDAKTSTFKPPQA